MVILASDSELSKIIETEENNKYSQEAKYKLNVSKHKVIHYEINIHSVTNKTKAYEIYLYEIYLYPKKKNIVSHISHFVKILTSKN